MNRLSNLLSKHKSQRPTESATLDGETLAEQGLLSAIENTPSHAYNELLSAIEVTARRLEYFDSSDVWAVLPTWTGSPSAMGGAIRQAEKDNVLKWTGMYQQSRKRSAHMRPVRRYQSLIYKGF